MLALLAGLYETDLRAVAVRRGLSGFASLLDDSFAYVPSDVIVPGALAAGELSDVASHLGAVRYLAVDTVDARNRPVSRAAAEDLAQWLLKNI